MLTLQIIGKGGFAREVQKHFPEYECQFFEFEEIDNALYEPPTVIAISGSSVRRRIDQNYPFNYVSLGYPAAGWGSIICPGTQITTGVQIGRHVIVNLNCTIGHDSVISDFVTLSPGVHVAGKVTIGSGTFIGQGVTIKEGVTICAGCTIGQGANVFEDIKEPGTYISPGGLVKIK